MAYNLIEQEEAIIDMQIAFDWYNEKQEGLGDELLEEIESSFRSISENPHHYTYVNDYYRRIKTRRFPYLIIYEIEGNNIIVNSLRHAKRNA